MNSRLLIVDDEESILFAFRQYFSSRGCNVHIAQEIEEAEAMICNTEYDVVVADVRLSGIQGAEGLDLVSFIRERSVTTRIIVLTAYATQLYKEVALSRGADVFLQKPVPLKKLSELITGFCNHTDKTRGK
jgi:DNA-binding NtrC family response regulator